LNQRNIVPEWIQFLVAWIIIVALCLLILYSKGIRDYRDQIEESMISVPSSVRSSEQSGLDANANLERLERSGDTLRDFVRNQNGGENASVD